MSFSQVHDNPQKFLFWGLEVMQSQDLNPQTKISRPFFFYYLFYFYFNCIFTAPVWLELGTYNCISKFRKNNSHWSTFGCHKYTSLLPWRLVQMLDSNFTYNYVQVLFPGESASEKLELRTGCKFRVQSCRASLTKQNCFWLFRNLNLSPVLTSVAF